MQVTPDQDFNEAFRRKFENFEVPPSQAVWRGIASELDKAASVDKTRKKVKVFPVFWLMAAASVLIVLSISLWLFSPQEKIQLHGKTRGSVIPEESGSINIPQQQIQQQKNAALKTEAQVPIKTFASAPVNSPQYIADQKPTVQEAPRTEESRVKQIESARTDVQDNMPAKDEKSFASADQPVFVASVNEGKPLTTSNFKDNKQAQPRIKSITDVVNFFVDKIDPREDKLIKFGSDGDGGSAVSGINLGFVRIKSRNK